MRAFIILGFVIAAASAASLGYNYGPGISTSIESLPSNRIVQTVGGNSGFVGGGRPVGGSGFVGGNNGLVGVPGIGGGAYQTSVGGNYNTGGRVVGTSGLIGTSSNLVGNIGVRGSGYGGGNSGLIGTVGGGNRIGLGLSALDSIPQTVEYSKQFFFYSAPEEHQDEGLVTQQLSNVLKKNLQVVFIKAPENNAATNAALQLAKQAIEQRTAIYVLTKENDGAQLVGQLQQIQENVPTTPEVRFIKYRTPEDIAYAKDVIQSQYDNFGGSSQVIDGGIAPVLNYASGSSSTGSLGVGLGVGGGISGGLIPGGNLVGGNLISSGKVIGVGGYGTGNLLGPGIGKVIGGGTTFLTGASNTNGNYLPPSPLKK